MRNSANDGFDAKTDYTVGIGPGSVAVGDFNGDGKLDLATSNQGGGTVSILQNATPKVSIAPGTTPVEGGAIGT